MSLAPKPFDLLKANLQGAHKVATRQVVSLTRIGPTMPLDATKVDALIVATGDVHEDRYRHRLRG